MAMKRKLMSIQARADTAGIRTQNFKGTDHLIIPMVILVEGVLFPGNAESPELALSSEFGKFPEGWNGRPVLLNHPKMNGSPVSASIPEVVEDQVFGVLFNTQLSEDKLKSEAWVDLTRLNAIGGEAKELVEKIRDGKVVAEVSTGLFMSLEESEGVYKGERFNGIWREVVPDHLAILSEGTIGACSVEDGCGTPRVNMRVLCGDTSKKGCAGCSGKCGESKLPGAAMLNGKTESEIEEGIFKALYQRVRNLLGFRDNREMSHRDTDMALMAALAAEDSGNYFYIIATYNDRFVYVEGFSDKLIQRTFQINEDDSIVLGSEKVQVRPVTDFVPVNVKADTPPVKANSSTTVIKDGLEELEMKTKEQRVQALIENKATRFTDSNKQWLLTLEDAQLDALEPAEAAPVVEPGATQPAVGEPPVVTTQAARPASVDEYVAAAPDEVRQLLDEGLRMQRQKRADLINGIKTNSAFTDAELAGFNIQGLEKMHRAIVKTPVFVGNAAGTVSSMTTNADDRFADEPPALVVPKSV